MKFTKSKKIISIIGIAISLFFLYVTFLKINFATLYEEIKKINIFLYLIAILLNFLILYLKSFRLHIFLSTIKKTKLSTIFQSCMVGQMANNILPIKIGEIIKIHLIGKKETISRTSVGSSLLADKLFETISMVLLFCIIPLFLDNLETWLVTTIILIAIISCALYGILLFFVFKKHRSPKNPHKEWLQQKWIQISNGLSLLKKLKSNIYVLLLSLLMWIVFIISLYCVQLSLHVTLPITASLLVLITTSVAAAIPSAPSNIGHYEFAGIVAYSFFNLSRETSLGIILLFHAIHIIPFTLLGLIIFWKMGLSWSKID